MNRIDTWPRVHPEAGSGVRRDGEICLTDSLLPRGLKKSTVVVSGFMSVYSGRG
jgi:hypothetical protein